MSATDRTQGGVRLAAIGFKERPLAASSPTLTCGRSRALRLSCFPAPFSVWMGRRPARKRAARAVGRRSIARMPEILESLCARATASCLQPLGTVRLSPLEFTFNRLQRLCFQMCLDRSKYKMPVGGKRVRGSRKEWESGWRGDNAHLPRCTFRFRDPPPP